ncbi:MAG: hypothetical protein NT139_02380 [Candidatus Woesearchaeota archaeon]|nr:hypothetical protein [Candidatus Woesearchaeota archaeon]
MSELRAYVLDYVKKNGPVLPVHVSKIINREIMYASAVLSELVSRKEVVISHAKIGGSPVYYVKGQESKLGILYDNLPQREKEAYDILKEDKVLFDRECPPAIRVALRNIKDFAIPLKQKINNEEHLLWLWHLITDEEFKIFLDKHTEEPKIEIRETPKIEIEEEKIEIKEPEIIKKFSEKKKTVKKAKKTEENFYELVNDYINKNNVSIINEEIIKKNKEIDMIVKVSSGLGKLDFYLAARNKKNISEGDLSLVYNKGQSKKLPVLFLSNGELSKKAQEYINKELKGYLIFKKI